MTANNTYKEDDTKQQLKHWTSHLCRRRSSRNRSRSSPQQQDRTTDAYHCPRSSEHLSDAASVQTVIVLVMMLVVVCFCPFYSVMSMTASSRHHHGIKTSKTMNMERRASTSLDVDDGVECSRSSSTNTPSDSLPKSSHQSRRKFFHKFLASTSATAAAAVTVSAGSFQPEPANAAGSGIFTYIRPAQSYMPYEDFKTLLETDQLEKVEFGIDGRSLVCLDTSGKIHNLKDMPDDRPLLKELYEKGVTVTLQEMKYEKKMNTINWFRDLVGVGDDLTDEEMYEYRGYKTYRQNIPERSYVPANLITGYDLSRNMRK